ncbi:HDIG domain-containing protein [SCandidatus Aminicenantes bacterium Aminicenantia_JdfR_composite]|nr:HDIG domain-containing protein [SCandidatus Aminicenantes bacterium Aminicenantia_JdfR_composite]MCP2605809.1 HDIG domain-containing protein [Candidatus Aminicenantes bacterium AC-335-O07]
MSRKQISLVIIVTFTSILALSYLLTYLPTRALPELKVGEIAPRDITAPINMTIQDKEGTERRRKEAIESVLPIYYFDSSVLKNTINDIRNLFQYGREKIIKNSEKPQEVGKILQENFKIDLPLDEIKILIRLKFDPSIEETLIEIIKKVYLTGVVLNKELLTHGEKEKGLTLVFEKNREKNIKINDILDLEEAKNKINTEVENLSITEEEKKLLKTLANLFLIPNVRYDRAETEARKSLAASSAEPVYYNLKKGKIIIRKGDEASPETVKLIKAVNLNLRREPSWLINLTGIFLQLSFLFIALWFYVKSTLNINELVSRFLMFGPILVLSVIFYKFFIFLTNLISQNTSFSPFNIVETYRFILPYALGALLFAFLTNPQLAILFSILNAIVVGYLYKGNFELAIFSFISCLAGIYGIKYYQSKKKASFFKAGVFVITPVNLFIITSLSLIGGKFELSSLFLGELLMSSLGAIFASILATSFFPLFEYIYGIVTDVKLLELCNLDLPIFRQMALEAPGTYHHSLMVASLAEEAANILKLNPLLIRTAALYHDIGKLKRPEYYIENQTSNPNLHKELTPRMSALIIINHVKDGIELANKLKLPSKIKEVIQQHHGTSLMRYFYHKAKETYGSEAEKMGEEIYRYPGPKPKSKEASLIMLADSVEAASRSLKNPTPENFKKVVKSIFDNYLVDGQLDESNITLKELMLVASSFVQTLSRAHHLRVEYPGFEFEKINSSKKKISLNYI